MKLLNKICFKTYQLAHACPEVEVEKSEIVHRYRLKIFSGSGVNNRLYCNFSLYFKTSFPGALVNPRRLEISKEDAKSSTSIFVKNDHFIAGFSSAFFKSSCREAILMRLSVLSAHVLPVLQASHGVSGWPNKIGLINDPLVDRSPVMQILGKSDYTCDHWEIKAIFCYLSLKLS